MYEAIDTREIAEMLIAIQTKVDNKAGLEFVMDYKGRFNIWEDEILERYHNGEFNE